MRKLFCFIVIAIFIASCEKKVGLPAQSSSTPDPNVNQTANLCSCWSYSACIQPILNTYCTGCHSSAPLDFSNYAGTKLKVDDGKLKSRVITIKDMPQGGPPLSANELQKIQCWLDNGAPNN